MKDVSPFFSVGRLLVLTGLNAKEGIRKTFVSKGYDITNEQFALLVALWNEDGQSQINLCEKICKNKPNVTRILDTMEKNGLVKRTPDKKDRRKFLIFLTDKGSSLQEPLMEIAFEYAQKMMYGLSEDDVKTLNGLLNKLNGNL